jgi:hypothetical protein
MQRPEVSTSNSSFFARFSIDKLSGGQNFAAKVGIADCLLCHKIDAAGEKLLEPLGEFEVSAGVGCIRLTVGHLDEEVKVAARWKVIRCSRAEEVEAFDPIALAKVSKRGKAFLDKLRHQFLLSWDSVRGASGGLDRSLDYQRSPQAGTSGASSCAMPHIACTPQTTLP